ncbi:MAG: carboxymuconolactone decarboxylase family protein [Alphaproteobacteria bacterium]|nr:carboxymuconolactone decarboxylase family protein [Alphaproteobacteria bacterium]
MNGLRSWVEIIKDSVPDHSKDIKLNLDSVMNRSPLSVEDTHACALVAALASGNGELAYAVMTSGELDNFTAEMEAAKTAASLMGMNNIWYPFVEMTGDPELKGLPAGLRMNAYATHGGVSKKKFELYALVASIIGKCHFCVKNHYDVLRKEGMTVQELHHAGKIAAVINAIGKIAPPI